MRAVVLATILSIGASSAVALPAEKLEVEVSGLGGLIRSYLPSGDIRRNVLSILSIEAARKEKGLTERRIRQLHQAAAEEIRTALAPFGYYAPVIQETLEKTPGGAWLARYEIDPGRELRFESVDLKVTGPGSELPFFRRAVADFPLKAGDIVNHLAYETAKKDLEDVAGENGFIRAAWTVHTIEVDLQTYTARAKLHLDVKQRYLFGKTTFHQDFLDLGVIQGYVTWREGDPLKLSDLLRMQDAMSDVPYFSRVEVETRPEKAVEDLRVPIDVTLTPSKRTRYTFGAGYGTDTSFRGSVGIQFRRLNRRGHHAEGEAKLSFLEQSITARYQIPGAYPRTDVLSLTFGYADLSSATAKSRTFVLGPSRARQAGRWRETVSLIYQRETYTVGLDKGISNLLIPGVNWSRVTADDRLETTNGYRLQLDVRGAVNNVLSNATFGQARVEGKLIRSLGARFRVIGRADLGVLATSDFRTLPPRIRYFTGGDLTVRGFSYNGLGTLDEEGNVIGGRFLRVASAEVDYKLLDRWGGFRVAAFTDVGNATLQFSGPLKQSVGTGLRWRSPIGVIRGDVAFAISEPGAPLKLHLNIGPDL